MKINYKDKFAALFERYASDKENTLIARYLWNLDCDGSEMWECYTSTGRKIYLNRTNWRNEPRLWYTLSDAPYGYCERDCPVRCDVTIIMCNPKWEPLYYDSNISEFKPKTFVEVKPNCLSSLEREKWKKDGLCDYLKKIMAEISDIKPGADEDDFLHYDYQEESSEVLAAFQWMGIWYNILLVSYSHTRCEAKWQQVFTQQKGTNYYCDHLGYIIPEY